MNILAWLRKVGYANYGLGFRDQPIDFEALKGVKSVSPEHPPSDHRALLGAIAAPSTGPAPLQQWSGISPPSPLHWAGPAPGTDSLPLQPKPLARSAAAPQRHQPTSLIGREDEVGLLLRAWSLAAAGQGQVVMVSGEAGIGKSRIVGELYQRRAGDSHAVLWHRCSSEHALTPFHGVIELVHQILGPLEEPETRLAELEALLAKDCEDVGCPGQAAALVADLLGIDPSERYPELDLAPWRLRSRTFEILVALFEGLARRKMVLAICEDLQWSDRSTLEVLHRLIDRIQDLPVLVLVTFGPGFAPAWDGCPHSSRLALSCLARGHCERLIADLSNGATLSEPVVEHIIERSGGVPLLVEEFTRAALERSREAAYGESADAPADVVPASLQEALTARLGASPEVAEIAQIGAVIGCEFSFELLAELIGWPEEELQAALDRLVASELAIRDRAAADALYTFKHALIRDAAYQCLPDPARRSLHSALARIVEQRCPDLAASAPLARHYAAAGLIERAVGCWLRAAHRAAGRCAHQEAIAMFSEGLELLDGLAAAPEPAAQRAELLAGLARSLAFTKGPAASEVAQAFGLARRLCEAAEEVPQLFPAVRSLWDYYNTRGDFEAAYELARKCQKLAAAAQDPGLSNEAEFCQGVSSLFVGRLAEARERLSRSAGGSEAGRRRDLAPGVAQGSRIVSLVHLAQALWLSGYPDQAARASQEAVATARAEGHPFGLTYALLGASWVAQFRRQADATFALAGEAIACASRKGFPAFLAMATVVRDWASVGLEPEAQTATAVGMRAAVDGYRDTGVEIARPYLLCLLADVHGAATETEPALAAVAEAAEVVRATRERWYEAEVWRQEGELLLRQSITNRRAASARFCQAVAVAQQQGSKSLELRATVSLARLWSDLGRRAQARDLLAPLYGWFHEGLDSPDLGEAEALLDQLDLSSGAPARAPNGWRRAPTGRRPRPCR
jgi:predicted ATPase